MVEADKLRSMSCMKKVDLVASRPQQAAVVTCGKASVTGARARQLLKERTNPPVRVLLE